MKLAAALLSLFLLAGSVSAATPDPPLLLTGGRVLDPAGEKLLDGRDVLIAGGKIETIAPSGSIQAPAGAVRIDLAGATLIPGLIDLHSHLLLHPYNETPWDDQVLKESLELRTIRGVLAARATLEAGFTTVRDLDRPMRVVTQAGPFWQMEGRRPGGGGPGRICGDGLGRLYGSEPGGRQRPGFSRM